MKRYLSPEKRLARDNARKERAKQRARLRGTHPRVHRFAFGKRNTLLGGLANDPAKRYASKTACGLPANLPGLPVAIPDPSFAWLPRSHQCERCVWAKPRAKAPHGQSGSPLTLTVVECLVLAIARLGEP